MYKAKKIMIIDGYNVLRSGFAYTDLVGTAPDFEDWTTDVYNAAREALLNDVAMLSDKDSQAIIVYDAFNSQQNYEYDHILPQKVGHVQVLFSDSGQTADSLIEKLVYNACKKGLIVTLITSDSEIQMSSMHRGVKRMSSREFCTYIKANKKEDVKGISDRVNLVQKDTVINNNNNKQHKEKYKGCTCSKLENSVDKKTAAKLLSLRNSL